LIGKAALGETVTWGDFFDKALKAGSRCRVCREGLDYDFRQFADLFAREIDDAVSQARCRLAPCLEMSLTSIFGA